MPKDLRDELYQINSCKAVSLYSHVCFLQIQYPSFFPTNHPRKMFMLLYLHISDHLPARSIQQDMHRYTLESVHLSEEQAGTGSYSLRLPCSLHTSFYLLAQVNFKQLTGVSLHAPEVQHFFFLLRNHSKVVCLCRLFAQALPKQINCN